MSVQIRSGILPKCGYILLLICAGPGSAACGPSGRTQALHEAAVTMIGRVPEVAPGAPSPPARIELGRKLFHDPLLSADRTISCNSCHLLTGPGTGVDHRRVSTGVGGLTGTRNSPTVWNAALHVAQFWDGRAATLEDQAGMPILNPVEMAMPDEAEVVRRLRAHQQYPDLFRRAFPGEGDPVRYANVAKAIAAFERTLLTTDRFDTFLAGDLDALSGRELKGLSLFMELGCVSCHNGPLLGGNTFRRVGGVIPFDNVTDMGRLTITGVEADRFVFKVPALRNVAHTGPYFHDGSRPTLESAIITMAQIQLGKNLHRLQVAYIADFLRTLSDPRLSAKQGR